MNDKEHKNTSSAACCYIPYIGLFFSIYNLFGDNKEDAYCRFHSYHAIFLWIILSFIIIGINLIAFISGCLPLIGPFLAHIVSLLSQAVMYGGIIGGIFCAYSAYQGSSFSIPYITEYTNKYLEDKKMLP